MDIEETNGKQNVQLAEHEVKLDMLGRKVDKILDNHLPHIQKEMTEGFFEMNKRQDRTDVKLAFWGGGLAVLTVVVPIIIKYLL